MKQQQTLRSLRVLLGHVQLAGSKEERNVGPQQRRGVVAGMWGGTALAGFAALAACQHGQETGVRAVVIRGSGQRNNEARRSLRLGVREAQTTQHLEKEKGRQAPLKKEYTALSLFFGRVGG